MSIYIYMCCILYLSVCLYITQCSVHFSLSSNHCWVSFSGFSEAYNEVNMRNINRYSLVVGGILWPRFICTFSSKPSNKLNACIASYV